MIKTPPPLAAALVAELLVIVVRFKVKAPAPPMRTPPPPAVPAALLPETVLFVNVTCAVVPVSIAPPPAVAELLLKVDSVIVVVAAVTNKAPPDAPELPLNVLVLISRSEPATVMVMLIAPPLVTDELLFNFEFEIVNDMGAPVAAAVTTPPEPPDMLPVNVESLIV